MLAKLVLTPGSEQVLAWSNTQPSSVLQNLFQHRSRALAVGLSGPVGACRTLSGHCRTSVGLSDCRTVKRVSDTVRHCRTRFDRLDVWSLSDAVGRCRTLSDCRTVGLSDTARAVSVGLLSHSCRTSVILVSGWVSGVKSPLLLHSSTLHLHLSSYSLQRVSPAQN